MFFPLKEWKRRRSRDEGKKGKTRRKNRAKEAAVVEEMCGVLVGWKIHKLKNYGNLLNNDDDTTTAYYY